MKHPSYCSCKGKGRFRDKQRVWHKCSPKQMTKAYVEHAFEMARKKLKNRGIRLSHVVVTHTSTGLSTTISMYPNGATYACGCAHSHDFSMIDWCSSHMDSLAGGPATGPAFEAWEAYQKKSENEREYQKEIRGL